MSAPPASGAFVARAKSDARDWLVEADGPLAVLQRRCGGDIPGLIAIPELLALVRKSRVMGLRFGRSIRAFDGEQSISAWAEVAPDGGDAEAGCSIGIASWHAHALPPEDEVAAAARGLAIQRELAELTARLDPQQRVLAAESRSADIAELAGAMNAAIGQPWTDFVELEASAHRQPLHWRLLDGAKCRVAGSERGWVSTLVPLGAPEQGKAGFELLLVADTPPAPAARPRDRIGEKAPPLLGKDLAPVLRQPISRIIANAETIRTRLAGPLTDEYSGYAADIAAAGQHLLALIDDLADLEVVEADEFTTAADRIDLVDVARRASGILGVRARERDAEIAIETEAPVLAIGEFRRVLQILLNLIGNALSYGPEGGTVRIAPGRDGEQAFVRVIDEGRGLSDEQQAIVFEKFERLGRSGDGGSGLGLYISRRLARAMGGDLTVSSAPGEGATFTLSLPGLADARAEPR